MHPRGEGPNSDGIYPDLLTAEQKLREQGASLGLPLHLLSRTESTNDQAKQAAKDGAPHGSTWVAESQDKGRGRQGRAWLSPPGENLLFSVLVRVQCPAARLPELAICAGLSVVETAQALLPAQKVLLKWPNDVWVSGKKLAGILVESSFARGQTQSVIVGIGLNVHTRELPEELAQIATSLALQGGQNLHRGDILTDLLGRLDRDIIHVAGRGLGMVHPRIARVDALRGVRIQNGEVSGVAEGIDNEGRLLVITDNGEKVRLVSGEVHLGRAGVMP
jgi:BirA family biotin operon repressor/biotin-[acetyl-CoA-carboxylase] ligase